MRRFISGPAISRLTLTPRMTVNDRLRAGAYGSVTRHKGIVYVDLQAVEASEGIIFSEEQIRLAGEGLSDSILTITGQGGCLMAKKSAANRLEAARAAVANITVQIAALQAERNAALISKRGGWMDNAAAVQPRMHAIRAAK